MKDGLLTIGKKATREKTYCDEGLTAFAVIPKPMNSATNTEDRLWFCDYLRQWDEHDFMHLTSSVNHANENEMLNQCKNHYIVQQNQ